MEPGRRKPVVSFEDLEVFWRGYRLSLEIHRISLPWRLIEQHALGDRMRRASKSICANVAEGYGRQKRSKAEFNAFCKWRLGRVTKCGFGCAMRSILVTSTRRPGNDGEMNIG